MVLFSLSNFSSFPSRSHSKMRTTKQLFYSGNPIARAARRKSCTTKLLKVAKWPRFLYKISWPYQMGPLGRCDVAPFWRKMKRLYLRNCLYFSAWHRCRLFVKPTRSWILPRPMTYDCPAYVTFFHGHFQFFSPLPKEKSFVIFYITYCRQH